jgi:ubiquinone/menaquinone biosynthesis C-methylase UbiE
MAGITQDQPIAPFDWFANQFTSKRREEFIEKIYPYMKAYLKPGDRVVDLCCGAGPIVAGGEIRVCSIDPVRS